MLENEKIELKLAKMKIVKENLFFTTIMIIYKKNMKKELMNLKKN